ncbi:MAG TPA: TraR/DksA family transcriptional regulator [Deltaproteobacteria bacterium]|nr:TraR/DksA family transcriptional regulator [Deltaproteobacteria bacterium]
MSDDAIRARLLALRAELEAVATSTRDQGGTVELDQGAVGRLSRMDALQQQAMAQAQEQRTRLRLDQIHSALLRLDAGDYGTCARCGEEIAEGRLAARPEAPFCLECAAGR